MALKLSTPAHDPFDVRDRPREATWLLGVQEECRGLGRKSVQQVEQQRVQQEVQKECSGVGR